MKIPNWIIYQIAHPATEGGRNNQCIAIGPSLIRAGMDSQMLAETFAEMHPDLPDNEIDTLVHQSCKYAQSGETVTPTEDVRRRATLKHAAEVNLPRILKEWQENPPETYYKDFSSHPRLTEMLDAMRRDFIQKMFEPNDIIWIGEVFQKNFMTVRQWLGQKIIRGCFVAHCTFKPGTQSRSNDNALKRKYMVVESDTLKPRQVMAVFRALEEDHGLHPRALVSTGGKSLHGWFDFPEGDPKDWEAIIAGYSCDPSTLRPSQPVRLPGCIRPDTGRPQFLLMI